MVWANFLHFYQPPTQKSSWVVKITAESYRKIIQLLLESPGAKLTLNVNWILWEHWDNCGQDDVIASLRTLVEKGQVELTGSAKYHPLLPFLPQNEVVRQIKLNEETHRKYLGDLYKPVGFFPPEMGFDVGVAKIVADLGYKWIIVDELSFPRELGMIDYSKIYTVKGLNDFQIFFRERRTSWIILSGQVGTGNLLVSGLGGRLHQNEYLLTAMDGETFGHHRPGLEHLLWEIYQSHDLTTCTISQLKDKFPAREIVDPAPSTWALMEKDLEKSKPFSRWKDEDNAIHRQQWSLTELAIKTVSTANKEDPGYETARTALDRALHSDQYWWASARPWWSIEMIERGAKELFDAISQTPAVPEEVVIKARNIYHDLVFTAFDWQRSGMVDSLAHEDDEDIRQRTDSALPKLPKEEVEKMIVNLSKELEILAQKQEFERAAQIRDRISELRRYSSEEINSAFSSEGDSEVWSEK